MQLILDIASSWWLHSTDHSSGDRPGWTNTKSTGWCPSIFVFFRKWIVWQLPSMVLKWKAPQSLLCHRSRQWQLQQCRSLHTTPATLRAFPFLYGSNFLLPYFNSSSVPHFQSYFSNSEIKFTVTKCQYLMSFNLRLRMYLLQGLWIPLISTEAVTRNGECV